MDKDKKTRSDVDAWRQHRSVFFTAPCSQASSVLRHRQMIDVLQHVLCR